MSTEAFNKVKQTHEFFKKIVEPLKTNLGISFGYMVVFKDNSYYQIIEDLECLNKWVINVEASSIFCTRNVTTYFDNPYNFTIWPEEPICSAMEIYKEYGAWNGITVSRIHRDYTELYWFTTKNIEDGWHKFFIRNKPFLLKVIECFISYKKELHITMNTNKNELFKFNKGFDTELIKPKYIQRELTSIDRVVNLLPWNSTLNEYPQTKNTLSQQQLKLLSLICQGYTTKMAAQEMLIKTKTAEHYIERIKQKLDLHYKSELIQFYKNFISNF